MDDGHRFRFYPLIDSNGNAVPNSWIVAVHEGTALAESERMMADALIDPSAHAAGRLVLTPRGRLLADAVIRDLT